MRGTSRASMGTGCCRRALPLHIAAAAFAIGLVWVKTGLCCSFAPEPSKFGHSANGEPTAAPPLPLQLKKVRVGRSQHAPPGPGDCSEVGGVALDFAFSDSATGAQQLGIGLTVIEGALPPSMVLSGGPYAHDNGTLSFMFADDPHEAFSFTLAARAVDTAGNQSSPTKVVVTGDPKPSDSSGGCSMSGDFGHSEGRGAVFLLGAALLLARRSDGPSRSRMIHQ
jgi:hypothetical protein